MIVVRVELHSVITHTVTELARMRIENVGGTVDFGDYKAVTFFGRNEEMLNQSMRRGRVNKEGTVEGHPRLREHVWNLVTKALRSMGYGQ